MLWSIRPERLLVALGQFEHVLEDVGRFLRAVGIATPTLELLGSFSVRRIAENHADSATDVFGGRVGRERYT